MKNSYTDFIGKYDLVFPDGYCEHLIKEFDMHRVRGIGHSRKSSEGVARHKKDDHQIMMNITQPKSFSVFKDECVYDIFFNGLQECYDDYTDKYSILRDQQVNAKQMKLQCTSPGGGYHIWHSEQGGGMNSNRVLVYMLYLNTLEDAEAGETEFLYQKKRYQPQENTMLLWPAAFTHVHLGNTVFGPSSKYIVTGWFTLD